MNGVLCPSTLRGVPAFRGFDGVFESNPGQKVTVGCLIAVAAVGGAEAQDKPLPPVTIDAPIARPKPLAAKPSPEQIRARNSLRRIARENAAAAARAKAEAAAEAKKELARQDPYADPAAPYKANRLASPKFPEPIVNTPRSVTVADARGVARQGRDQPQGRSSHHAGCHHRHRRRRQRLRRPLFRPRF
jgi:catecholate siderophore receptor